MEFGREWMSSPFTNPIRALNTFIKLCHPGKDGQEKGMTTMMVTKDGWQWKTDDDGGLTATEDGNKRMTTEDGNERTTTENGGSGACQETNAKRRWSAKVQFVCPLAYTL